MLAGGENAQENKLNILSAISVTSIVVLQNSRYCRVAFLAISTVCI